MIAAAAVVVVVVFIVVDQIKSTAYKTVLLLVNYCVVCGGLSLSLLIMLSSANILVP